MEKKRFLLYILISCILLQGVLIFLIPTALANSIPSEYYQQLDLNGKYIYNVTQFNGPINWLGFDYKSKYNTSTNAGGQIIVNFTGFYDKDPNDIYNEFQSPMPYMDVEFVKNKNNILVSNHTFYNVSNGEAAFNILLGYNKFQSGFLIPINNLTYLKDLALAQDVGYMKGTISIEESYNFICFDFKQDTKYQNTTLVYEKQTGLLVWAKTMMLNYFLEMQLINFSLNLETVYSYNVSSFGDAAFWYDWNFNYVDTWTTNPGGLININFTGFYPKDPNEPSWASDVFPDTIKRAWFNIEVFYKGYFGYIGPILSLSNISNREAAIQMSIGFGGFQSGFLLPMINNMTFIYEKAIGSANPGEVIVTENALTVKIDYSQSGGLNQKTTMIYEKLTGLLLWVRTELGSYNIEMKLIGYDLPEAQTKTPPQNPLIPSFEIWILMFSLLTTTITIAFKIKKRELN
ncbi:MAG: hypothetical protein ACTSRH_03480 [Promethearchaeota archaeon]